MDPSMIPRGRRKPGSHSGWSPPGSGRGPEWASHPFGWTGRDRNGFIRRNPDQSIAFRVLPGQEWQDSYAGDFTLCASRCRKPSYSPVPSSSTVAAAG
jgi:hypothetical protein